MDINLLHTFCASSRGSLNFQEPFSDDSYSYFCDGNVCVRVDRIAHITREVPESICSFFAGDFFSPPSGSQGEWIKKIDIPALDCKACSVCNGHGLVDACEECGGDGVVLYHGKTRDYDIECPRCEEYRNFVGARGGSAVCEYCEGCGRVETREWRNRLIGKVRVKLSLLHLVNALPGVAYFAAAERYGDGVNFCFTGGCGVVMGLSKEVTSDEG